MTTRRLDRLRLGWLASPFGSHPAAWLHPDAQPQAALNLSHYIRMVQIAEAGKMDFVFQADVPAARDGNMDALRRAPRFMSIWEPLTLLSALAPVTTHIGLAGTSSASYYEPYNLARQYASLDHLSGGRAGWNVVTSAHPSTGYNFGRDGLEPHELRYERAREFMSIVLGLWDSWDDDAFPIDRESGIYFDPTKMHYLRHEGKFFKVRGPLNIARCPQGRPVIIQAGGSEAGKELAAKTAEVVFGADGVIGNAQRFYADLKGRMENFSRAPEELAYMPGLSVTVGRSMEEANERFEMVQSLIHPDVGRELLSDDLEGIDLSGIPLDSPIPLEILPATANRHKSYFDAIVSAIKNEGLTLRQLYQRHAQRSGLSVRGTPSQIADKMEEWFQGRASDGFMLTFPTIPGGLEDFVKFVVPELQRRGLFREEYEGRTLRDNLGLKRPKSRYATAATQSAPEAQNPATAESIA
jgi:FMN-dependent oxidoreductase (nitrilotriacetate monooxygenase family)